MSDTRTRERIDERRTFRAGGQFADERNETGSSGERAERERSAEEERTAAEEESTDEQFVCPECGGTLITDETHGETVCSDCGLVVDEDSIDRGPEWRA
ncbi:TFIIB-type zinc ribbon-containing protein, partial [Halobellus captivus]|uniref:TFIIB-type zinc ribbon-containing protein n=1 Tax=Halobellus captivus TaxID=2592614 RepID=UPI0023B0F3F9